ncbi:hypothetical protein SLEP1_g26366 [Rubroshorea leprosula]|uniref:GLTSCR protein conserved domain-containing protein n=1 Tax=Rubroshorea leprosula TaxID=152421 RepID=A0AAV5JT24_9ROSI|nr:hypothetical protein SLEP1_g26366 [Rubroshorea leprosula]
MENKSQNAIPNPGSGSRPPDPGNQPQARQQLLSQNIQNDIASTVVQNSGGLPSTMPSVGLTQNPIPNVGQNSNLTSVSGISLNMVGNSAMVQPSNMFANPQKQMHGMQQQQQQQSQNPPQLLCQPQLHHLMKQKFQQGNLSHSPMQSHIQQQQRPQQNLLQPTQFQSSQQSDIKSPALQSTTLSSLQQNQQSCVQSLPQSMPQKHPQSVLSQQQQPQEVAGIHQQQGPVTRQSMIPQPHQQPQQPQQQQQQPHLMGQQANVSSRQHDQFIGQLNNLGDFQQRQQRLFSQQNNLPNLQQQQEQRQQQQLVVQQNNLANVHQAQLPQNNIPGLQQQQQQQMLGKQLSNSSMQANQHSLQHMVPQSKVPLQQIHQTAPNFLSNQGQTSLLQQQLGLRQQPNSLQRDMQQRLQTPGSLLQQQNLVDQQKQLHQSQRAVPDTSSTLLDSTVQTGHPNGGDWQEEVYQKIISMKDMYSYDLNEVYQRFAKRVQQHESLPQPPKSEQLDKLKLFKATLERLIAFISISSKENITLLHKEKLGSSEKHIVDLLASSRPRKPVSLLQQGQLPQSHLQVIPRSESQLSQVESHDNQINPQSQSVNMPASMQTMQQKLSNLQHNSLMPLPGFSSAEQNMLNSLQTSLNMDSGQGNAHSLLQQVAAGSLQQSLVIAPQQANINNLSSQSGVNVPQPNLNMLQPHKLKQEQPMLQTQSLKLLQQAKQQMPPQVHQMSQLHQTNDVNDMKMRQGMGVKPGVFHLPKDQHPPYPHQQLKPGSQFPISSSQPLQVASPQMPQHFSQQVDHQNLSSSMTKTGTPLQSANSSFVVPSPSSPSAPSPLSGVSEKPMAGTSLLSNTESVGNQPVTAVQVGSQSLAIGTPGISASPLLAEFTGGDTTQGHALSTVSGKSTVTEQPLDRLIKVVKSLSPEALSASVNDIGSFVGMIDRIAGSAPGNGSRAAVGEDLVAMTKCRLQTRNFIMQDGMVGTKRIRRYTSAMPLNAVSSAVSMNDSLKQLTGSETSDLDLTATSIVKRPRTEVFF